MGAENPRTQGTLWVRRSSAMARVLDLAERYAQSDGSVLILGETGTGKGVMAAWIHEHSKRGNCPLIVVNCAALPEGLAESEIFGHEKGAFSDAVSERRGLIETAEHGGLYLDDVENLPLPIQAKLLHLLGTGQYYRLGSSIPRTADVRIYASAAPDIKQRAEKGTFRLDLYFRLAVLVLVLPPLKQRLEDIEEMVKQFSMGASDKNLVNHLVSSSTLQSLLCLPWKGNVRELKNWVERCLVEGQVRVSDDANGETLRETLKDVETRFRKAYVQTILREHHGNKTAAARRLGLSRTHLIKIMHDWEQGEH